MASTYSKLFGGAAGGKYRFQEFKTSGTFTPSAALLAAGGNIRVSKLVGAGGAGGGYGYGGGGAVLSFPYNVSATGPLTVTIGTGGAIANGGTFAMKGGNSSFGPIVAAGGSPGYTGSGTGYGGASGSGYVGTSVAGGVAFGGGAAGPGGAGGPGIDGYGVGSNGATTAIPNSGNGGQGNVAGASGYCLVEWSE